MMDPDDADDGGEQTPLLGPAGDSSGKSGKPGKAGHPVAKTLAGFLSWPASISCPDSDGTGSQNAFNERNSPKTSLQSCTVSGSRASHSGIHLATTSGPGSPSDIKAPSEESPSSLPRGIENTPSWGVPAGLEPRKTTDESVVLFPQAVGINNTHPGGDDADPEAASLEHSSKLATGIYGRILKERRTKTIQYTVLNILVNTCHVIQILVGASLTALGSEAATHKTTITALGATNTILAGIFALLKGQGLPDRLHKDAIEYRRVQDWIEETDALVVSGVVGRDRKEIGLLIETAFKKYNAVKASEENNKPGNYVLQQPEATRSYGNNNSITSPVTSAPAEMAISSNTRGVQRGAIHLNAGHVSTPSNIGDEYLTDGNSVVRLDLPSLH